MTEFNTGDMYLRQLDTDLDTQTAEFLITSDGVDRVMDALEDEDSVRFLDSAHGLLARRARTGTVNTRSYFGPLSDASPEDTLVFTDKARKITFHALRDNPEEPDGDSPLWVRVAYDISTGYGDITGHRSAGAEDTELDRLYNKLFENPGGQLENLIQFIDDLE